MSTYLPVATRKTHGLSVQVHLTLDYADDPLPLDGLTGEGATFAAHRLRLHADVDLSSGAIRGLSGQADGRVHIGNASRPRSNVHLLPADLPAMVRLEAQAGLVARAAEVHAALRAGRLVS